MLYAKLLVFKHKGKRWGDMELRHLEYFLMLSNELHFTKAAEKLSISQPTLSHQIKLLEKELGYALFNRVGKKVELTAIGEIVQQEAMNIQASVNNIYTRITSMSTLQIGDLKVAALPGELTDLVSTICIHFNELYPNIKICIETTDQIEEALYENRADFGIGFQFQSKDWLQATKLYEEEFYVIRNDNSLQQTVTLSEALENPLILFPNNQQCRKLLNKACQDIGKPLTPVVETSSISSILNLVRHGVGQSIVSRTLFEFYDTQDLYYQRIEQPTLQRTVYLMMKKDSFVNFAVREYMTLLYREIDKLQFHKEYESIDIFK